MNLTFPYKALFCYLILTTFHWLLPYSNEMPRSNSSAAWNYFVKQTDPDGNNPVLACTIAGCTKVLTWHKSTTSMLQHLRSVHPYVFEDNEKETHCISRRRTAEPPAKQLKTEVLHTAVDTITFSAAIDFPRISCVRNVLYDKIAKVIVEDSRPVNIVNESGFRDLITTLDPNSVIPTEQDILHFIKTWYFGAQIQLQLILSKEISNNGRVALAANVWTCSQRQCLTLTIHTITSEWKSQHYTLATRILSPGYTSSDMVDCILGIIAKYEVPDSAVLAFVHADSPELITTARELSCLVGWKSVKCVSQLIQTIVSEALKANDEIADAIDTAEKLVDYIKKNDFLSELCKKTQSDMGVNFQLERADWSRWNSLFEMIQSIVEQQWTISSALSGSDVTLSSIANNSDKVELNSDQWSILQQLVELLKPFEAAVAFFSKNEFSSVSAYPMLLSGLERFTRERKDRKDESGAITPPGVGQADGVFSQKGQFSPAVDEVRKILHESLLDRCIFETDAIETITAALDPRFSKLKHLKRSDKIAVQEAITALCDLKSSSPACSSVEDDSHVLENLLGIGRESNIWSSSSDDEEGEINDEVSRYFRTKISDKNIDPLKWWKQKESPFPSLANLARQRLCIPATSASSQEVFTASGQKLLKLRSCLEPENLDMLVFLHDNKILMQPNGVFAGEL